MIRAAILMVSASLLPAPAGAWLENGTILTNAASATYMNYGGPTSVTYSATMRVFVASPQLHLWKDCTPTVASTIGGIITFTLAFSNGGANTAFNVTLTDKVPNAAGAWFMGLVTSWSGAGVPAASWSGNNTTWATGVPPVGQQGPATSMFLRWVVPSLGLGVSGSITFTVSFG